MTEPSSDGCFVVVEQYQFPISAPYHAGYTLSETEAAVLNWHRARLVQKLVTRWAVPIINSSPNDILSVEEVASLATEIADFDSTYELEFKREPKSSILEYHLNLLALDFLKRSGVEHFGKEAIERIKRTPQIQERARDRIRSGVFSFEELLS
jgi:hypothetical protein